MPLAEPAPQRTGIGTRPRWWHRRHEPDARGAAGDPESAGLDAGVSSSDYATMRGLAVSELPPVHGWSQQARPHGRARSAKWLEHRWRKACVSDQAVGEHAVRGWYQ